MTCLFARGCSSICDVNCHTWSPAFTRLARLAPIVFPRPDSPKFGWHCSPVVLIAEASCTSAIASARDFVADVGERVAQKSGGLLEVSRCSLSNPERDCQRVIVNKFSLTLDVERSHLESQPDIPILRIRSWFEFFLKNSCIHILHGLHQSHEAREKAILSNFWQNFRRLCPNHAIFDKEDQGLISLPTAVPLLLHGDEGRGRRHTAHFVLSFHSIIGFGFAKVQKKKRTWAKMECNFAGHSFTNRFLIASLRKGDYADQNSSTWDLLMRTAAEEAHFMWETGVASPEGQRYWGVVIGIIGDWPFLHKCGSFSRSFNNIQRRAVVRNSPNGICHLCRAAQVGFQFEQLGTRRPDWLQTLFSEDPFLQPNPFVDHLLYEPQKAPAIWCFDWFHTMHLGVLKSYLGSLLALFSEEEPHGSIDCRFQALTEKFKTFCCQNSRRAHVGKLSKEMIGWETTSSFPGGQWHKGALTTVLMEFAESRFNTETFPHQPLLGLAAEACEAVQACSRFLYRSDLWLEPAQCNLVAELGFKFLRRYAQMASLAQRTGRCLFVLQPKIHCLHHFMVELLDASNRNVRGLNPLGKSCQPSEDFIGRPSRLARRVTAQRPVLHRIMDRYLLSTYGHFVRHRYLIRGEG